MDTRLKLRRIKISRISHGVNLVPLRFSTVFLTTAGPSQLPALLTADWGWSNADVPKLERTQQWTRRVGMTSRTSSLRLWALTHTESSLHAPTQPKALANRLIQISVSLAQRNATNCCSVVSCSKLLFSPSMSEEGHRWRDVMLA
jgi:hypothetical protein